MLPNVHERLAHAPWGACSDRLRIKSFSFGCWLIFDHIQFLDLDKKITQSEKGKTK
jgi:hypothetical protein